MDARFHSGDTRKITVLKVFMERMNAYTKLTESEFFSIGSTIFRKVVKLPAPKLVDACSKEPSICFSPATACRDLRSAVAKLREAARALPKDHFDAE